jgi:hypothetical protein
VGSVADTLNDHKSVERNPVRVHEEFAVEQVFGLGEALAGRSERSKGSFINGAFAPNAQESGPDLLRRELWNRRLPINRRCSIVTGIYQTSSNALAGPDTTSRLREIYARHLTGLFFQNRMAFINKPRSFLR